MNSNDKNNTTSIPFSQDTLVDIRSVEVDTNLPKRERIADFLRQIKNPYHFRCGEYTVKASYATDGAPLDDCLQSLML